MSVVFSSSGASDSDLAGPTLIFLRATLVPSSSRLGHYGKQNPPGTLAVISVA